MSAAATDPRFELTPEMARNLYLRAVWQQLSLGAFMAALAGGLVVMLPPLRASIIIEHGGVSLGLTILGVSLVAAPFVIWAVARVFARGPNFVNPLWYWLFVIAAGAASNTLAVLFFRDSVISAFVLVGLGFAAVALAHRVTQAPPIWVSVLLFIAVGLGGEWIINATLKETWPFVSLDLGVVALFALLIAFRANAFDRIRDKLRRPRAASGATFAAMHLIALANAPMPAAPTEPSISQDAVVPTAAPQPSPTTPPPTPPDISREEADS